MLKNPSLIGYLSLLEMELWFGSWHSEIFRHFVDELLYIATNKTMTSASRIKRVRSNSLEHYVAAALVGFLIILILIIVTMLR
jgi:hypothetical protein